MMQASDQSSDNTGAPRVLATKFMMAPAYIFSVRVDGAPDWAGFHRNYKKVNPIDPNNVPTRLVMEDDRVPKQDIFAAQGMVMVVSERLAELLSGFDLGLEPSQDDPAPLRAELLPLTLYAEDKSTKISDVAILQVSNHKGGWLPEQSQTTHYIEHRDLYLAIPESDETLTVIRSALEGPDLWRHRRLDQVVFLSDRLFQTMVSAGMKGLEAFYPCRMVDG